MKLNYTYSHLNFQILRVSIKSDAIAIVDGVR